MATESEALKQAATSAQLAQEKLQEAEQRAEEQQRSFEGRHGEAQVWLSGVSQNDCERKKVLCASSKPGNTWAPEIAVVTCNPSLQESACSACSAGKAVKNCFWPQMFAEKEQQTKCMSSLQK